MSIIEKSKKLLNLLKSGTGIKSTFGECYFDEETKRLLDIAVNECKSTIWRKKDGKIIRYESDIDIQTVKEIVELFASDKTYIPKGITSTILSSKLVMGPAITIPYSKKQDGTVQIDNVFGISTLELLGNSEEKQERFIKDILEPIIEEVVDEDKTLKNKHKIGKIMNKLLNKRRDRTTILEKCEEFLKQETGVREEDIKAIATYLINSIKSNIFMQDIIEDEKNGNSMTVLGDKRKGYAKMIYGMAVNAYDKLSVDINEICNSRIQDVRQIYSNLIAQIEAEAIDLNDRTPDEIERIIKKVNNLTITTDRKRLIGENGYRNIDVQIRGKEFKLQPKELVEPSMKNLIQSMKELIDSKDSMTKEEYITETVRLHYRFIKIHPFSDGNGRTGRAISNMLLAQIGETAVFQKENKDEYIRGTNMLHYTIKREFEEQAYLESLATGTDYCKQIEDKYLYLLEEYVGMKCIKSPIEYDRDITENLSPIQPLNEDRG